MYLQRSHAGIEANVVAGKVPPRLPYGTRKLSAEQLPAVAIDVGGAPDSAPALLNDIGQLVERGGQRLSRDGAEGATSAS